MALMIPPVPYGDTKSEGEVRVFEALRDDPGASDWVVLHSVNLAQHISNISGEADFIVIAPGKGILVLEVKGCSSISRKDGLWFFGKSQEGDRRGPFRQASEAMHSLRKWLKGRVPGLENVLFWSACVFPFTELSFSSPEWNPWQVIDSRHFGSKPISQLLDHVFHQARALALMKNAPWAKHSEGVPSALLARQTARVLRPNFEVFAAKPRRPDLRAELKAFTDQQYRVLDALSANPRLLVEGPAGSGKTVLAVEMARRLTTLAPSSRVLLTCFNRLLAQWLGSLPASSVGGARAVHLHKLMLEISGARADGSAPEAFFRNELPRLAIEAFKTSGAPGFDVLVMDEAQDFMEPQYMDFLESILVGGWDSGRWYAFGDFQKQAIFGKNPLDLELGLDQLRTLGVRVSLKSNCRNTPRIAQYVRLLGGLDPDYDCVLRPDDGKTPRFRFCASVASQLDGLVEETSAILQEGFVPDDVVVLSARSDEACLAAGAGGRGIAFTPLRSGKPGVRYCTIHAFKGLEAPAVIVTDVGHVLGDDAQELFYVAITRAQSRLVVVAPDSLKHDLVQIIA
jgi:hypothetical protein